MKTFFSMIIGVLVLSQPTWAQRGHFRQASTPAPWSSPMQELNLSVTRGSFITSSSSGSSTTLIAAAGEYSRLMMPNIQFGGGAAFVSSSGGGSSYSYFEGYGTATYNMLSTLAESLFFKGYLGMFALKQTNNNYETKFGFGVGIGKRFSMFEKVSYAPELIILKKGSADPGFEVNFLAFSLIF